MKNILISMVTLLLSSTVFAEPQVGIYLKVGLNSKIDSIYSHTGERISLKLPVNLDEVDGVYLHDGTVLTSDQILESININTQDLGKVYLLETGGSGGNSGGG